MATKKKETKKTKESVDLDNTDWGKYNALLGKGIDPEDALKLAKKITEE